MAQTHKDGYGFGAHEFWSGATRWSGPLFRLLWDLEIVGTRAIPRPSVVAANHYSHLDPVVIGQAVGPVRYLAVDELYGNSQLFDAFITHFGAIPMTRTKVPLQALRTAIEHIDNGGVIGMFPEGRRVWTWREVPPKRGAAWLAHRTGVPLVPVAVWGTQESMGRGATRIRRWPVRIEIGRPIHPGEHLGNRVEASWAMMERWQAFVDGAIEQLRG